MFVFLKMEDEGEDMSPYPEKAWNSFYLAMPAFSHASRGLQISLPMTFLCVFAVKWTCFLNWLSEMALLCQTSSAHFSLSLFFFNWSSYFPLTFMPSLLLSYVVSFFFPLLYHYLLLYWPLFYGKTPSEFKRKEKKSQTKFDLGNQHKRANSIQHSSTVHVSED